MFITTKNKRSQILFRRTPGGIYPPDVVLDRPVVLSSEKTVVVATEYGVVVDNNSIVTLESELRLSVDTELVLSLACPEE